MTVGERIRAARMASGMTLEELAIKSGTIKQTIYKYECGRVTNIPFERVESLAAALHVSPAALLGWEETGPAISPQEPGAGKVFKNLKSLRLSYGLTQAEFAESLGISKTMYSGYEQGTREPGSAFWIAVAQKYGVTVDYLMGFSDLPSPLRDQSREPAARKRLLKLTENFDQLNADGQEKLVEYSGLLKNAGEFQKNFQAVGMEKEA